MALINKLNNIGDAIRAKTGKEDKLTLEQMVTEIAAIETGGSEPAVVEALVVTENGTYTPSEGVDGFSPVTVEVPTGAIEIPDEVLTFSNISGTYLFANDRFSWFINNYGDRIITEELTMPTDNLFLNSKNITKIPFSINFMYNDRLSSFVIDLSSWFEGCINLVGLPHTNKLKVKNMDNIFKGCYRLKEIPSYFYENWDWFMDTFTGPYEGGNRNNQFRDCYSLRKIPMDFLAHGNKAMTGTYSCLYYGAFYGCYTLDEIVDLPIPYTATWTSNAFVNTFYACYRLKNMTFALQEDGTPYTMNWKSQTIDLSKYVGYCNWTGNGSGVSSEDLTEAQKKTISTDITKYNSGITVDKMVYNDATYQALKDDPDWYYVKPASGDKEPYYSRYNHDSAVETINSLPDTSAYLASAGGTNTIKFTGAAGSKTDGGAINTLTEEEIAVATAKGWTVTLV